MEVTTSAANQTEYPAGQDPARWRVLIVLLTALFMSLLSVSIVNVALPSIQSGLGASESDVQWVLSGYALTFGVILVAAGRAGDLFGRGGIFLAGIAIYSLSAAVAGFAPNAEALNAARFIQGIGAGLLNPQGVGMIQQYFRGPERARAFEEEFPLEGPALVGDYEQVLASDEVDAVYVASPIPAHAAMTPAM